MEDRNNKETPIKEDQNVDDLACMAIRDNLRDAFVTSGLIVLGCDTAKPEKTE